MSNVSNTHPETQLKTAAKQQARAQANRREALRYNITAYLFMAPYLLLFIVFLLIPAVVGVFTSFTKWGITGSPKWIGIDNYTKIFSDDLFLSALKNTFYFAILTAIPLIVVGFFLALLVHQKLRGRTIARTIIFLPHVVSVSSVGIVWTWILDRNFGLLNYYLKPLGVNPPIGWLTQTDTAMLALAITTIWWTVNTNMIIYLAGLQDIPEELYEAARIDGGSSWQLMRYVTIPMLMPVNAFVIPLTIIASWRVFGQAFVMTQGGPQGSTFTIAQYIYLTAFQNFKMGQASAAGVILMLIILAFTVVQLRAMKSI